MKKRLQGCRVVSDDITRLIRVSSIASTIFSGKIFFSIRQNGRQLGVMNLTHGHDSEFCKRQITQRTSRLNAKIRSVKTICITYLDLMC